MDNDKKISFLATGSELILGDVQDSNCRYFAQSLNERGATIYQHIQASDRQSDISSALRYLLKNSDAVIVTGGLGPTSDDTTRFAIAKVIKQPLLPNKKAWAHIVNRLKQLDLPVVTSNRQQTLFPVGAILYPNTQGTAFGCHIKWQNKHIFMLPGPPKECCPLFDKHVIATLKKLKFFTKKKKYRWLTLGLSEGAIAMEVDALANPSGVETAYRWHYPYLEIKITAPAKKNIKKLIQSLEQLLAPYTISRNGKNAFEICNETMSAFSDTVNIFDDVTNGQFAAEVKLPRCHFVDNDKDKNSLLFCVKSTTRSKKITKSLGTIHLECTGYINNQWIYNHQVAIPNRGPEVIEFIKSHIAWQLSQFVKTVCKNSS
ncbi:MAG TPA: competence/damage-inducible protein A [Gammaproteobacteria bacterium]|jgi:molybdenum cofactor synthesis domain-containing protein|nr:competence/damage-inducible protein A [Gammaproteobacteria bacterium]